VRKLIGLIGVVAIFFAGACSGGDSDGPASSATLSPVGVSALQIGISHDRVQQVLDDPGTSEDIKAVLSDDVLTFPEYEASILAAVACIKDAGGGVANGDPRLNSRGLYSFVPSWPIEHPELQAIILQCIGEHVGVLDLFWKELVSPSAKDIADAMEMMAGCMQRAGLGDLVPESRAARDFQKLFATIAADGPGLLAYVRCATAAENEYGLIGFAPYTSDGR
jgi:hypothetical protein